MRRTATVLIVVAAGLVLPPIPPAWALPILDPLEAEDLARELAQAAEVQGICYGWHVQVHDAEIVSGGLDQGSSLGTGKTAKDPSCLKWMIFEADLNYTSSTSESEDSATFRVTSNVAGAPQATDLRRVGVSGDGLLGADDDVALVNATLALPALAAELRLAPPLPLERNTTDIPAADRPTNRPGSDWHRAYRHLLILFIVLLLGGLTWAGWAWGTARYREHTGEGDDE